MNKKKKKIKKAKIRASPAPEKKIRKSNESGNTNRARKKIKKPRFLKPVEKPKKPHPMNQLWEEHPLSRSNIKQKLP